MTESKFKVGDWAICNESLDIGKITSVETAMGLTACRLLLRTGESVVLWASVLSPYNPSFMDRLCYWLGVE